MCIIKEELVLNKFCSFSVPSTYLAKHINMLLKEAELRVDDLTTAVVHVSYTASSEIKVMRIVVKVFFFPTVAFHPHHYTLSPLKITIVSCNQLFS